MNKCIPRTFIKLEGQLNLPEESPIKMGGRAYFKRSISKLVGALVVPIIVGGGWFNVLFQYMQIFTYHKARETLAWPGTPARIGRLGARTWSNTKPRPWLCQLAVTCHDCVVSLDIEDLHTMMRRCGDDTYTHTHTHAYANESQMSLIWNSSFHQPVVFWKKIAIREDVKLT